MNVERSMISEPSPSLATPAPLWWAMLRATSESAIWTVPTMPNCPWFMIAGASGS
jgi:hypothetical protein